MPKLRSKPRRRMSPETLYWVRQVGRGLVLVLVCGVVITAIWFGTRISSLTISEVVVVGGRTVDHERIKRLVNEPLEGSYFRLIPRRFAWLYPHKEMSDVVLALERVRAVHIERNGTTVQVVFDEYVPYGLWCESPEPDSRCVFIDQTGYAFGQAPMLVGGGFVRFVQLSRAPHIGEVMTERETVAVLDEYLYLLQQLLGLYVATVELDGVSDAFFTLVGGGELKVSLVAKPDQVVDNLRVILDSEAFSHLRPGQFQYIDLRFGNKVYVNEEVAPTQSEGATAAAMSESELLE